MNYNHGEFAMCDKCEKSFKSQKALEYHIRLVHADQKPFICEKCKETFVLRVQLKTHMEKSHDTSRPFECSICFRTFNLEEKLDHHFARVHQLRNCKECPHCGKKYSRLSSHLPNCPDNLTVKGRPRFECSKCNKSFSMKSALNRDMKQHCKNRMLETDIL